MNGAATVAATLDARALRPDAALLGAFWDAVAQYDGEAVWEVRGPKTKRKGPRRFFGTLSGYFNTRAAFVAAVQGITGEDVEALYLTLNPAKAALLARAANRLKDNAHEATADTDILRRTSLLIDIDPNRPSGTSSTDAERDLALAVRDSIQDFLTEQASFPEPLARTMSGNGAGLVYRLDLPNDDDATQLVTGVLAALAHLFDMPAVKVDTANFNAARITKIIGTVAAKGDNVPERPWRLATGTVNPDALAVSREALEWVAALAPKPERPAVGGGGERANGQRWDLRALLTRAEIGWRENVKAGYTVLELDRCLTSQDHVDGAALFQFDSGAVAYRCLHARCSDKRWADVRSILAPGADTGRARKAKCKRGEVKPKTPLPPELAERRIHPALHFDADGFGAVGILDGGTWRSITSDRRDYPTEAISDALAVPPVNYPALGCRWQPEDRDRFLSGDAPSPSWSKTAAALLALFRDYLEFDGNPSYVVLALWSLLTYLHQAFPSCPRLNAHGEKGSGKSKLLRLVAAVSFNGLYRTSPRPAGLFRLIEALRPTLCLDEIEHLDRDDRGDILAILNAGYQAGGAVDRCVGDEHTVTPFNVFAPVALAGIRGLNAVLSDRCITLILQPGQDRARVNRDLDLGRLDPRIHDIRDSCYRLALTRWTEARASWEKLDLPTWLNGRTRELWGPLLALAALVFAEDSRLDLRPALLAVARPDAEDRAELPEVAAAILAAIEDKLAGADSTTMQPGDLADPLKVALGYPVTPTVIGLRLKALGFKRDRGRKGGSFYTVSEDDIQAIMDRRKLCDDAEGGTPPHNLIPDT